MTVQKLINLLLKIENKNLPIYVEISKNGMSTHYPAKVAHIDNCGHLKTAIYITGGEDGFDIGTNLEDYKKGDEKYYRF